MQCAVWCAGRLARSAPMKCREPPRFRGGGQRSCGPAGEYRLRTPAPATGRLQATRRPRALAAAASTTLPAQSDGTSSSLNPLVRRARAGNPSRSRDKSRARTGRAARRPTASRCGRKGPWGKALVGAGAPRHQGLIRICSLTSDGRAATARSNALTESANEKVSEISGFRSTRPDPIRARARSYWWA